MCLSIIGKIVKKCWTNIPDHFTDIELMDFFIMPDHLHGILNIQRPNENNVIGHDENIGDRHDLGLWNSHGRDIRNSHGEDIRNRHACSLQLRTTRYHQKLPVIIGSFKSSVTRLIRKSDYGRYFAWQKSYYDRIIRNDNELKTLRNYIKTNPRTWTLDEHSNNP
jgi:REP element-mobilizing transposase RayT